MRRKIQKLVFSRNSLEFPREFGECQIPGNFMNFPVALVKTDYIRHILTVLRMFHWDSVDWLHNDRSSNFGLITDGVAIK